MVSKENQSFFIVVWIIWAIMAFCIFGMDWVPADIKVYTESGFSGVSVPGPIQLLMIFFFAGWPIFGWMVLD